MTQINRQNMQVMHRAAMDYNQGATLDNAAQAAVDAAGITNPQQLKNFSQDILAICEANSPAAQALSQQVGLASVNEFNGLARSISAVAEHLAQTLDGSSSGGSGTAGGGGGGSGVLE